MDGTCNDGYAYQGILEMAPKKLVQFINRLENKKKKI